LIRLHLLGTVDLRSDAVEVRSVLAQPKRLALLAYLASAAPRGFHSRDTLLALFWPESDGERARNSLRQALHQLRRSLGDEVIVGRGDREVGLDPALFWCDAAAFDEAVEEGRFEDALKLYRGDLLPGFFIDDAAEAERWLEEERARRRRAAVDAAWKLAEQEEARGEWRAAALWAERAVAFLPSEETALRRLLVLLERAGEPAAALAAFAEFERRLREEYGLTPSAETLRMVEQLRRPVPAAPPAPVAASPTPVAPAPEPAPAAPLAETSARVAETPASVPAAEVPSLVPIEPVAAAVAVDYDARSGRRARRRWGRMAAAAAAVLVLLAGGGWFVKARAGDPAGAGETPSIAVLPFVNLSGNKENDYFSDGLAEELLNVLAQVPELRVASRTSSFGFRGNEVPVDSIGRALHVAHVLEGSVRQYESRVRITAQLIDARTGYHVWSETYDRELKDIFAIQDEISRAIVDQLHVRLAARRGGGRPETRHPDAYAQILKANFAFNQGGQSPRDRYATAIGFLQEAIRIDPEYAEAYAKLADATQGQAYRGYIPAREGFARARQLAERALALDPGMPRAHYVLGRIAELHEWDFPSAQEHYRRSVELAANPDREPPSNAFVLLRLGRRAEAVAAARKSSHLQPDWPGAYNNLGSILSYLGEYGGAIQAFRAAQALAPTNPVAQLGLANTYLYMGNGAEAVKAAEVIHQRLPDEPSVLAATGAAYALAGRRAEAERILRDLQALDGQTAYAQASVHAVLGNRDRAFALLDQAVAQRESSAPDLGIDPTFRSLRGDPRMPVLLRRIGLPAGE
jgi:serine/threonine-protein kinase